uniref:Uncharacterized protein n=1 Tax=Romanomermis culicivorax TaxID=13658 RepID=A0A915I738_ROMCU
MEIKAINPKKCKSETETGKPKKQCTNAIHAPNCYDSWKVAVKFHFQSSKTWVFGDLSPIAEVSSPKNCRGFVQMINADHIKRTSLFVRSCKKGKDKALLNVIQPCLPWSHKVAFADRRMDHFELNGVLQI